MPWREHIYLASFYPLAYLRIKLYQLSLFLFFVFVVTGGGIFHAANAATSNGGDANSGDNSQQSVAATLETHLLDHPLLRQSAARACRAIFVLGQRKAEQNLDLSATISGERQLASNFKTNNSDPLPSSLRAYNRVYDDVYDLELSARYRVYDWGVGDARVRAEEGALHAERLTHQVNFSGVIEDILRVMMQIESAKEEVAMRQSVLADIAPHVEAIEAQGKAGSIGLAQVREAKLSVLNAEVALQRAERRLDEVTKELNLRFKMSYEQALPVLQAFLEKRHEMVTPIEAKDWLQVRVLDARIVSQKEDLFAINNERYPVVDTVFEATGFDLTDWESEYQLVGRLELSMPLYDGGANKARQQEKSWQVSELNFQREEQLRNHETETQQGMLIMTRRALEIANTKEQIADIDGRYQSLNALVGNSLVSRQQIIQLLGERTQKTIELLQLEWQHEFGLLRLHSLANALTPLLGITVGENQC